LGCITSQFFLGFHFHIHNHKIYETSIFVLIGTFLKAKADALLKNVKRRESTWLQNSKNCSALKQTSYFWRILRGQKSNFPHTQLVCFIILDMIYKNSKKTLEVTLSIDWCWFNRLNLNYFTFFHQNTVDDRLNS